MTGRQGNGYVLNVAPSRRQALLEAMHSDSGVAEALPEFTHSRSHPLICFVSFDACNQSHLVNPANGKTPSDKQRASAFRVG